MQRKVLHKYSNRVYSKANKFIKNNLYLKSRIIKIISVLMLFVFFLGVAPKEYIHDVIFRHQDTVDHLFKKGEFSYSSKHRHCSFLGFVLAPFVFTERQSFSPKGFSVYTAVFILPDYAYKYSSLHAHTSLRGPPALS